MGKENALALQPAHQLKIILYLDNIKRPTIPTKTGQTTATKSGVKTPKALRRKRIAKRRTKTGMTFLFPCMCIII